MGKLIITKKQNRLFSFLYENNKLQMIETAALPSEEGLLGNIYIAKVNDVIKGIRGAFLSISPELTVYLPLDSQKTILCANKELSDATDLHQQDEIVIQISGEALKTKQPTATCDLTLTGQYVVCRYFGHGIKYSKKITPESKSTIEAYLKSVVIPERKKYQFTIRTNVAELNDFTPLMDEMNTFIRIFNTLTDTYKHRTCYSCLYQPKPELVRMIQNLPIQNYDEIVTDEEDVFRILSENFPEKNIRFYQDNMLSLSKLYSIDTHLTEALSKKVWLSCGGYLIIEPTEAMTVIDVNSGKAESKNKNTEDYIFKINLEAAKEVARQLRLRNYSGIIMVDFINMDSEDNRQKLLYALDSYLKEDKIRTRLIDITALGIVEITRKKISKPLADFFVDKILQKQP